MNQNIDPNSLSQQTSQSNGYLNENSMFLYGVKREKFRTDIRKQEVKEILSQKRRIVFELAIQGQIPQTSIHECFDKFMRIPNMESLQEFLNHFPNEDSYRQAFQYQLQIRSYLLKPRNTDPEVIDKLICLLINIITLTNDKIFTKADEDDGYRFLFQTFDLMNNMDYRNCHEDCIILIARMFENNLRLVKVMAVNKERFLTLLSPELEHYSDRTIDHFSAICATMLNELIQYKLDDEEEYIRIAFGRALDIGDIYTIHGFLYLIQNMSLLYRKSIIDDHYEKIVKTVSIGKQADTTQLQLTFQVLLFCIRNSFCFYVSAQIQYKLLNQLMDFIQQDNIDYHAGIECLKVFRHCLQGFWYSYGETLKERYGNMHQIHWDASFIAIKWIMKQKEQSYEFIKCFEFIFELFHDTGFISNDANQCYVEVMLRILTSSPDRDLIFVALLDLKRVLIQHDQQSLWLSQLIKQNHDLMSLIRTQQWESEGELFELVWELVELTDQ